MLRIVDECTSFVAANVKIMDDEVIAVECNLKLMDVNIQKKGRCGGLSAYELRFISFDGLASRRSVFHVMYDDRVKVVFF